MPIAGLQSQITSVTVPTRAIGSDDDLHELLTIEDVAALLKVSKSWVYEYRRARGIPRAQRLPHIKVGKYVRFEARALRAFIDNQCRTTWSGSPRPVESEEG